MVVTGSRISGSGVGANASGHLVMWAEGRSPWARRANANGSWSDPYEITHLSALLVGSGDRYLAWTPRTTLDGTENDLSHANTTSILDADGNVLVDILPAAYDEPRLHAAIAVADGWLAAFIGTGSGPTLSIARITFDAQTVTAIPVDLGVEGGNPFVANGPAAAFVRVNGVIWLLYGKLGLVGRRFQDDGVALDPLPMSLVRSGWLVGAHGAGNVAMIDVAVEVREQYLLDDTGIHPIPGLAEVVAGIPGSGFLGLDRSGFARWYGLDGAAHNQLDGRPLPSNEKLAAASGPSGLVLTRTNVFGLDGPLVDNDLPTWVEAASASFDGLSQPAFRQEAVQSTRFVETTCW